MEVSREDPDTERALAVCVPCTTEIRGRKYEVALPRVRWMPGTDEGVVHVLGIASVEHHRLDRRAGRYDPQVVATIRERIGWMIEL